MASKTVTMTNPTGLHTRPGGVFVAKAKEFESKVEVENEGKKVNGKSLLKLLSIGTKSVKVQNLHSFYTTIKLLSIKTKGVKVQCPHFHCI